MQVKIADNWKNILNTEFEKSYFKDLSNFVKDEYQNHTCYPPEKEIFAAFDFCTLDNLKVVILGQDPYHNKGEANGLCFSVKEGVKIPSSLRNIFKELNADVGKKVPVSGDLSKWAKQGVLMLNAILTVRADKKAASHQKQGWETFTDEVIKQISSEKENVVFLLWGKYAKSKIKLIDKSKHHILESVHPSGLSAYKGWFGSKHFSKTNTFLKSIHKNEIDW